MSAVEAFKDFAVKVMIARRWLRGEHAQRFPPSTAAQAAVAEIANYMAAQHRMPVDPVVQGEMAVQFIGTHRLGDGMVAS